MTLYDRIDAAVVQLRIPDGEYLGLPEWALSLITSVLIREGERGLATEEKVGDRMMKARGWSGARKGSQAEEGRRPPKAGKDKETDSWLEPPESSSPADTLTLTSKTDFRLLTSTTLTE